MKNTITKLKYLTSLCGICCALLLSSCSLEDLLNESEGGGSGLSSGDIVEGLKAALKIGTQNAVDTLNEPGSYLIAAATQLPLPEDVENAFATATQLDKSISSSLGDGLAGTLTKASIDLALDATGYSLANLSRLKKDLLTSMISAASAASDSATPIFKEAIFDMTISDGLNILQGDSIAATAYFKNKTLSPLTNIYSPYIAAALDKVDANAKWKSFADMYNSLATVYNAPVNKELWSSLDYKMELQVLDNDLAGYTTGKALAGLFYMVGEEEAKIRSDPLARVSAILKKVFGEQD